MDGDGAVDAVMITLCAVPEVTPMATMRDVFETNTFGNVALTQRSSPTLVLHGTSDSLRLMESNSLNRILECPSKSRISTWI